MLSVATPDDLEAVFQLLLVMHAENGIGRVDEPKARGAISEIIKNSGCLLAWQDNQIVGSVGLTMTSWWYSRGNFLTDMWFFVHPDHRTEGHATRLIGWMKSAADHSGVPVVLSVGTKTDALSKLKYFRKHLTPFGGAFIYEPKAA
jgi:GNAT superfamily N-acetyltransferase